MYVPLVDMEILQSHFHTNAPQSLPTMIAPRTSSLSRNRSVQWDENVEMKTFQMEEYKIGIRAYGKQHSAVQCCIVVQNDLVNQVRRFLHYSSVFLPSEMLQLRLLMPIRLLMLMISVTFL